MAAPDYIAESMLALENIKKDCILEAAFFDWSANKEISTVGTMTDATAMVPIQEAVDALVSTRSFVQNNNGSSVTIEMGGKPFTLANGSVWCASPNEASFILAQALEKGYSMALTDVVGYQAAPSLQFFFE